MLTTPRAGKDPALSAGAMQQEHVVTTIAKHCEKPSTSESELPDPEFVVVKSVPVTNLNLCLALGWPLCVTSFTISCQLFQQMSSVSDFTRHGFLEKPKLATADM